MTFRGVQLILFVRVDKFHHERKLAHCPSSLGQLRLHVGKGSLELVSSDVEIALPLRSTALRALNVAVAKVRAVLKSFGVKCLVRSGGGDGSNPRVDDEQKFHFGRGNCRQIP